MEAVDEVTHPDTSETGLLLLIAATVVSHHCNNSFITLLYFIFFVDIKSKLKITKQPAHLKMSCNDKAVFMITANGPGTLTFQWYHRSKNSESKVPITEEGADSNTLVINSAQPQHAGHYSCCVRNEYGDLESEAACLNLKVSISKQPKDIILSSDKQHKAVFEVSVEGEETIKYHWMKVDQESIAESDIYDGVNGRKLTIKRLTEEVEGEYYCVVNNDTDEEVMSKKAKLIIGNIKLKSVCRVIQGVIVSLCKEALSACCRVMLLV